jgi:hypothetical protein
LGGLKILKLFVEGQSKWLIAKKNKKTKSFG